MKNKILSYLLHHANRSSKAPEFYAIKTRLLKKHGVFIGHDVQHIPGKKCFSCQGTGIYTGYSYYDGSMWEDICYQCNSGWYKRPMWVVLERYRFGKYVFHQPLKKVWHIHDVDIPNAVKIDGYIDHKLTKHGLDCLHLLYILFDFNRWRKNELKTFGLSYFYNWSTPYRFINNIIHVIRKRHKAYCFASLFKKRYRRAVTYSPVESDDLPF